MNASKVLTLGLLFSCPLALARVQLNSSIEIDNPVQECTRTIATEVQLDPNESAVIYDNDEMRIETRVVFQQASEVVVSYALYMKNAEGNFELVSEPTLCVTCGDTATIAFGQESAEGEQVDSLRISVNATEVQ